METIQIRVTKGLLRELDKQISKGVYPSRSEAIRNIVASTLVIKRR